MTTLSRLLPEAVARLRAAGVPDPATDARILLAHAAEIPPDRLTLHLSDPAQPAQIRRFDDLIGRRAGREPVSHLTGQRLFWGRLFHVAPAVLDPRPETETVIAAALAEPFASVLDLGTGSGCILLTLLAERPLARGIGVDLSPQALSVARLNTRRLDLIDRAAFAEGNWFGALSGRFDLIVSNPPYIAAGEMAGLAPEVRLHEPRMALTDEADGLTAYRAIAAGAADHLEPGGRLIVEIGPTQAAAVAGLLSDAGLTGIETLRDLDGRDRVVLARRP